MAGCTIQSEMDQYPRQYLYLRAVRAKLFVDENFASNIDQTIREIGFRWDRGSKINLSLRLTVRDFLPLRLCDFAGTVFG